jgi:hypothetical protein
MFTWRGAADGTTGKGLCTGLLRMRAAKVVRESKDLAPSCVAAVRMACQDHAAGAGKSAQAHPMVVNP